MKLEIRYPSHPDAASVASDPVSIDAEDFEEDDKE